MILITHPNLKPKLMKDQICTSAPSLGLHGPTVKFSSMITNEACLANLTAADDHSVVLVPEGERSLGHESQQVCGVFFTCFGSGVCVLCL